MTYYLRYHTFCSNIFYDIYPKAFLIFIWKKERLFLVHIVTYSVLPTKLYMHLCIYNIWIQHDERECIIHVQQTYTNTYTHVHAYSEISYSITLATN